MTASLSRKTFVRVARAALRARRAPITQGKDSGRVAFYALVLCRSFPERFLCHLRTVLVHKACVFVYCAYAGMPFRGLVHDLSKFSPTEFLSSVKFYNGRSSPVGLERALRGYSLGWLHHKGRNKHHYEYWQDAVDESGRYLEKNQIYPLPMPFPNALEMICDTIAASRAYNGRKFSYDRLMRWWIGSHNKKPVNMHPQTERFAQKMYEELQRAGNCRPLRRAKEFYRQTQIESEKDRD